MATIKLPDSLCSAIAPHISSDDTEALRTVRTAVKTMIESAIGDELPPASLPPATEAGISMNITFAGSYDKAIRSLAKRESIREGDAALRYLYAAITRGDLSNYRQSPDTFLRPFLQAASKTPLHHQNVFADYVLDSLGSTAIGLIEGATGIGKTLAMIAAAAERLKNVTYGRCAIATPTLQLLRQFAQQHAALEAGGAELPPARVIMGKAEFVCVFELSALLQSGTVIVDVDPIREWLAAGGPPVGNTVALGSTYLLESLRTVSPAFPVEAVRLHLDADPDDPGLKAYRAQFARADDDSATREIIYCTHAMLAADLRTRMYRLRSTSDGQQIYATTQQRIGEASAALENGESSPGNRNATIRQALTDQLDALLALEAESDCHLLPPWQHLLIDEAHQFETNVANTMASNLSLNSYVRNLAELSEQGILPKTVAKRAQTALAFLRNTGKAELYDLSASGEETSEKVAALQEMVSAMSSLKKQAALSPHLRSALVQTNVINAGLRAARENRGGRALLTYSPVRAFPQLSVGRKSVQRELAFLWGSTTSACCISATLYFRKLDKDSAGFIASILSIPQDRMREYPPVRPAWVTAPVSGLWTPPSGTTWLRPPTRRDKLAPAAYQAAEQKWLDDLHPVVQHIHATAVGGVLCLMGSYESAQALGERLADSIPHKIVASQNHSLHGQMQAFIQYGLKGKKALWIAVGGAWTGVDINGANFGIDNPADDNLLTDLVIPRLPFGHNRSMTHASRVDANSSVPWELLEATMRLKQGLGRPIRRPGLPHNRRFFVLDNRLHDPLMMPFLTVMQRILDAYPQKTLDPALCLQEFTATKSAPA